MTDSNSTQLPPRVEDETGNVYGKLTVLKRAQSRTVAAWNCQCECGNVLRALGVNLRMGRLASCGSCGVRVAGVIKTSFDRRAWNKAYHEALQDDPVGRERELARKRISERKRLRRPDARAAKRQADRERRLRLLAENPQYDAERTARSYKKAKLALFRVLGSCCKRCGITDIRVIQFHHTAGDGKEDRKGPAGRSYIRRLLKRLSDDPEAIVAVCANCHIIMELES